MLVFFSYSYKEHRKKLKKRADFKLKFFIKSCITLKFKLEFKTLEQQLFHSFCHHLKFYLIFLNSSFVKLVLNSYNRRYVYFSNYHPPGPPQKSYIIRKAFLKKQQEIYFGNSRKMCFNFNF
jgi:hypothetical protein